MVEEIRIACKANGTSIWALEQKLGFGNGTIRRWDNNAPSFERLSSVAEALGISVAELTGAKNETLAIETDDERQKRIMIEDLEKVMMQLPVDVLIGIKAQAEAMVRQKQQTRK